jgi:hypothetical protein
MTNNLESGPTHKVHFRSNFYADDIDVIFPHPHPLPHMLNRNKSAEFKKKPEDMLQLKFELISTYNQAEINN